MALDFEGEYTYKTQTTGLFEVADEGATASPALGSILALIAMFGAREGVYRCVCRWSKSKREAEREKSRRMSARKGNGSMLQLLKVVAHV
jgi:hypothetical protein